MKKKNKTVLDSKKWENGHSICIRMKLKTRRQRLEGDKRRSWESIDDKKMKMKKEKMKKLEYAFTGLDKISNVQNCVIIPELQVINVFFIRLLSKISEVTQHYADISRVISRDKQKLAIWLRTGAKGRTANCAVRCIVALLEHNFLSYHSPFPLSFSDDKNTTKGVTGTATLIQFAYQKTKT